MKWTNEAASIPHRARTGTALRRGARQVHGNAVTSNTRFGGEPLAAAAAAVLGEIKRLGGDGSLIAFDAEGTITLPFASPGLKRAALHPDGRIEAGAF